MRRLVFAAPFVMITSCERPVEHHHRTHITQRTIDAGVDASTDGSPAPQRLVDELEPLGDLESPCDEQTFHYNNHCNPPRPSHEKPDPVTPLTTSVLAMKREDTGTRVRLHRPGTIVDRSWRAEFLTTEGQTLADGSCDIVRLDFEQLECVTKLAPEAIVDRRGTPLGVSLVPPKELVDRIEKTRKEWRDDVRPPPGWPGGP